MKQVHVPVRIGEDGRLQYLYGGPVPEIAPGTVGELVVPDNALTTPGDAHRVQHGHRVELLPAGSTVWFAIDGSLAPEPLSRHLKSAAAEGWTPGKPHAVEVVVNAPVIVRLRSHRPPVIEDAPCQIAALQQSTASLDDAYELILRTVEQRPRPGVGSALHAGFWHQGEAWIRLDELCQEREARYVIERSRAAAPVLAALPSKVSALLRLCWTDTLESPRTLLDSLAAYEARLHALHERSEVVDIGTADELLATCRRLATAISPGTSEDRHRLIQAAIRYLLRETDDESDTRSPVGFLDDALVVRTVASTLT